MKWKSPCRIFASCILCSLLFLLNLLLIDSAAGQVVVSGPDIVVAGEAVTVQIEVVGVTDPWLLYQFGDQEQKIMILEAEESQGSGIVVDDPAASGGKARAGEKYAQVIKTNLPPYDPALYIWYRGRAADFCLKDFNNKEITWHWAKGETGYKWRRFGPYAPSELAYGFGIMVGSLASGYDRGFLDAVLITTDPDFTPPAGLPLPKPGQFIWETDVTDIGEHEIPVKVYDMDELIGSTVYNITVTKPAELNLFEVDFTAPKISCINPALFGTNDQEILKAEPFEDEMYQVIMGSMNMEVVRIHLSGRLNQIFPTPDSPGDFSSIDVAMARSFLREDRSGEKILFCFAKEPSWVDMKNPAHRQLYAEKLVAMADYLVNERGYPIAYWEVFNEIYGSGMDSDRVYWKFYNLVAPMLKAVTPNVKVGGPALAWPTGSILRDFLRNCKDNVDFLSWHLYPTGSVNTPTEDLMAETHIFGNYTRSIKRIAEEEAPGKEFEFALTEYNINYDWNPHDPRQATNVGAVWAASVINHLAKAGHDIAMTWHSKGGGTFGLVSNTNEIRPKAELIYLHNKCLRNAALLPVDEGDQKVEILAARKGKRGIVLLINKYPEAQVVRLTITEDKKLRSPLTKDVCQIEISDAGPYTQKNIHFFEEGENYGTVTMPPYSLQLLLFENYLD